MPELPEVETVRNTLKGCIIGKRIIDIKVRYNKIIQNVSEDQFRKMLIKQTFLDIKRKGKYLICVLNDYYLIIHLRMEGKFFLMDNEEFSKHDHIIFQFIDGTLRYNDTRKFGTMHVYKKDTDIYNIIPLKNVAPDPLDPSFDINKLYEKISSSSVAIKGFLLDQSNISGLGNIYVDEVLFLSKLDPRVKAKEISFKKLQEIVHNCVITLNKAINLGGTTIKSFQSSHDITGRFQNELLVHTKKTCPDCNEDILKIRVASRGTYYCPNCQKTKP